MTERSTTINGKNTLFASREQCVSLALDLVKQAKRQVCFFAPTLDSLILNNTVVIELLSVLARSSEKARIKLLVHDSQTNIANGHRLLPITQTLTSTIALHKTAQQHKEATQLFIIIDDNGYLYCPYHNQYQGRMSFDNAAETRQLQRLFDSMWEQSIPDSSLRRLHI